MNFYSKHQEVQLIIAQGSFFADSTQSLEVRKAIFKWVVERALYNLHKSDQQIDFFDIEAIKNQVCRIINPDAPYRKQDIPNELITVGLALGVTEKNIITSDNAYKLSIDKVTEFESNDKQMAVDRVNFLAFIINNIRKDVDICKDDIEHLETAIESFIYELISIQCFTVAETLQNDATKELKPIMDNIQVIDKLENSLRDNLKSHFGDELVKIEVIINNISDCLSEIDISSMKYLVTVFNTVMYNKILRKDPELRKLQNELLKDRIIYLDDNVVITAMLTTHPGHNIVEDLLRDCALLGIKLRINPEVLEAVNAQFKVGKSIFEDKTLPLSERLRNCIVSEFYSFKYDIQWDDFESYYLPIGSKFCKQYNIEISDESYDPALYLTKECYKNVWNVFKENKDKKRLMYGDKEVSDITIDRDTNNFFNMHEVIDKYGRDLMGQKVWFITLDKTLKTSEYHLKHFFSNPYSKHISEFINFILPYKINLSNNIKQEEYIKYLISSNLGAINLENDLSLLDCIKKNKIDLKKLLSLEEPEAIQEILNDLATNREKIGKYLELYLEEDPNIEKLAIELKKLIENDTNEHEEVLKQKDKTIKNIEEMLREKDEEIKRINQERSTESEELYSIKEKKNKENNFLIVGIVILIAIIIILLFTR